MNHITCTILHCVHLSSQPLSVLIQFITIQVIYKLVVLRRYVVAPYITSGNWALAWFLWVLLGTIMSTIASLLVVKVAPVADSSGIPEVCCHLIVIMLHFPLVLLY